VTSILWSPQALRDLEAIRDYIAVDSPRYAALMVERIAQAVERLRDFPQSGRIVPERNHAALREVIVRPYRIVYRLRPGTAEIATVFRASRVLPEIT
jgi:addiction module RelE/StbE family toxin